MCRFVFSIFYSFHDHDNCLPILTSNIKAEEKQGTNLGTDVKQCSVKNCSASVLLSV